MSSHAAKRSRAYNGVATNSAKRSCRRCVNCCRKSHLRSCHTRARAETVDTGAHEALEAPPAALLEHHCRGASLSRPRPVRGSSKEARRSSMKRGSPSAPWLTASTTSSEVPSPRRARARSRSAPRPRGDSSSLRTLRSRSAPRAASKAGTPGSGSGRWVRTSSNGPCLVREEALR